MQKKLNNKRLLAGVIDTLIFIFTVPIIFAFIFVISLLFAVYLLELTPTGPIDNVIYLGFYLFMGFIFFGVIPYKHDGKSIGKMITGIKVVTQNNQHPNMLTFMKRTVILWFVYVLFVTSIIRLVFPQIDLLSNLILIGLIIYVGLIIYKLLIEPSPYLGHDKLAKTKVIYAEETVENSPEVKKRNEDWASVFKQNKTK